MINVFFFLFQLIYAVGLLVRGQQMSISLFYFYISSFIFYDSANIEKHIVYSAAFMCSFRTVCVHVSNNNVRIAYYNWYSWWQKRSNILFVMWHPLNMQFVCLCVCHWCVHFAGHGYTLGYAVWMHDTYVHDSLIMADGKLNCIHFYISNCRFIN